MFNIFSSYIQTDLFTLDIKKIKKEILYIKSKDKGRTESNYGGWQSQSFGTINKNFKNLFNNINTSVKKIEKHLKLKKKLSLKNYWCNINYFGSFNRPHTHEGCTVSGVYYVDVHKNSGNIIFINKNLNSYYKEINIYNEYNSSTWKIEPEKNLCVLFPSHLNHYVEPNLNKKERISISFNYV
jgi:uncharacterized protein (TIGR02466 family)|tara:strand:- start:637 stop:1185 length:549 start_codon:yes stop_codon:yes gene_type:complete